MARIELPKEIVAIHGRIGDYVFRSRGGKQYIHYQPKKKSLSLDKTPMKPGSKQVGRS